MQKTGQKSNEADNKKIGILTYHFSHNCGAVLQAFALMKTVQRYSECFIIDYQPDYHASWGDYRYKYEYPPTVIKRIWTSNKNKFKAIASIIINSRGILRDITYHKDKSRTKAFENFVKRNMQCSPRCKELTEVETVTRDYHALITGSDQIWNTGIVGDSFDDVYFLKVNNHLKRYSYAASAGNGWNKSNIGVISDKLRDFDGISIREADLKEALEKRGLKCRMDIDPSLLLDKTEYYPFEEAVATPDHYVFIYAFQITPELVQALRFLREKLNCEFFSSPFDGKLSEAVGFSISEMEPLGPATFLHLMHHADYVVTSTFHGLAFATIYKKPFVCLPPKHGKSRIDNFLSMFGLQAHYWQDESHVLLDVDYSHYDEEIQLKRDEALKYIRTIVI